MAALACVFALVGCQSGAGLKPVRARLVIASGVTQGVYYRYAAALAGRLQAGGIAGTVENRSTSGSVENLRLVARNEVGLGFAAADAAADAFTGRPPFTAPVQVRAVALLYDEYVHLVVPANSRIRSIADLTGARVAVGPDGSGTALISGRLLELSKVRPSRSVPLGLGESIEALRAGRIDAFFWSGGLSSQGIVELARKTPIRLVSLEAVTDAMRSTYGVAYRAGRVQAGTYQGVSTVTTLAVPDVLVTPAGTDADLVREVTRLLFTGRDTVAKIVPEAARLDRRTAIFTAPLPLHPGAVRYYRSITP